MATENMWVTVTPELKNELKKLAYAKGLSMNAYARMVLIEHVTDLKKKELEK